MRSLQRALLKSSKAVLALSFVAMTAQAQEESKSLKDTLGLTGSLRVSGFEHDKSGLDQDGYLVSGLWLNKKPEEFFGIKSVFDYRIQGQDLTRNNDTDGDLREAYLERSLGNFDLKAGRFITVWGRADKVNPTDVFSTRNYNLLVTDDEDQRLGIFTTQVAYNIGSYRLIALWQPEWRKPTYPIGQLPQGTTIDYGVPEKKADQYGFKLDHSGGVDWSLSYAHAVDRGPDISVLSATANSQALQFEFNPIDVYGADMATAIGSYGLRGEIAYTKTKDSDGTNPGIKNSNIFGVLGVERTFDGNFNVNVQYLHRYIVDFRDPSSFATAGEQALAQNVAIYNNQLKESLGGASLRLNYKMMNETLDTELVVVNWFYSESYGFVRPKISYAFSDAFRGTIGYEKYYGPTASLFGRMKDMSSGFAELRWLF